MNTLKRYYYAYLRDPRSVADALKALVSPKLVEEAEHTIRPADLVDCISDELKLDPLKLAKGVASLLKCDLRVNLAVPSLSLVEATGHSAETLHRVSAVPQMNGRNYVMIVADPFAINQDAFKEIGVKTYFAPGSTIATIWAEYFRLHAACAEELSENEILSTLIRLADDGLALGAVEILIGVPTASEYELLVKGKTYRGEIPPTLFAQLARKLETSDVFSWNLSHPELQSVRVCHRKNLMIVTWTQKTKSSCKAYQMERPRDGSSENTTPTCDILLLDDSEGFIEIVCPILEREGFSVEARFSPQKALTELLEHDVRPRVIVSDVHMPQLDGVEFLSQLRDGLILIPVMMLTSDEDPKLEAELAALGCDHFLRKQEHPDVFVAWVKNLHARTADHPRGPKEEIDEKPHRRPTPILLTEDDYTRRTA